jgi:hypothetical protein
MPRFNLESYLRHSKKVDVCALDFAGAAESPLSTDEIRCLTYLMDIKAHTTVFLKGILSRCATFQLATEHRAIAPRRAPCSALPCATELA